MRCCARPDSGYAGGFAGGVAWAPLRLALRGAWASGMLALSRALASETVLIFCRRKLSKFGLNRKHK